MTQNTNLIPLTQGQVALVDATDYEWLSQRKWYALRNKWGFYAVREEYIGSGKTRFIYMHRQIMDAPKGMQVDHANGDKLDNRRANLRLCTNAENSRNSTSRKGSSSAYLGVCWDKQHGKWLAKIRIDGRTKHLGRYETEIDAAMIYDAAARIHHGKFANPNFPE